MYQMVSTIYYFFWVRYHPSRIYSQKKSWQETKYRPPFPPTTKPRPLSPLDHGPTSLVLVGYRLVVLHPFCACSTVFYVCLPRRFCRSRLVLFRSALCFVLFLHVFPATFVIFLWFGFSFLHVIPAANTSCHSLFLFTVLLILVLTPIFYTKGFGPCFLLGFLPHGPLGMDLQNWASTNSNITCKHRARDKGIVCEQ